MYGWIVLALLLFPVQLFVTAPYGRHQHRNWGPAIDNRLGWIVMEIVSPLIFATCFILGPSEKTAPLWFMFSLWIIHYTHRSLVYPLRIRTSGKIIPVAIVAAATCFNFINGWSNGWSLGSNIASYSNAWFLDIRFSVGLSMFLIGAYINIASDNRLLRLRSESYTGYRIPYKGMFQFVSCPNHLGEIVQWIGFAILCWNLPATAFSIWTAVNLIPRAIAHHKWYKTRFPKYPTDRKALIPYLL